MTAFPAAGYISTPARTEGEQKTALEDFLATTKQIPGTQAVSTKTIASGAITPDRGMHAVDTEAAAASDDLDTINTTNLPDGFHLLIFSADNARNVVVRHNQGGAGKILLADAANLTLDDTTQWLLLRRAGSEWLEVDRGYGVMKALARAYLAVAGTGDANVFTATQTIRSTDSGTGLGPELVLDRNKTTPADNDVIGGVTFQGNDSAGADQVYARIQGQILDELTGSEDGLIDFHTAVAGTVASRVKVGQGVQVGAPTGGDKGPATLNATALHQAGVQVPMVVFQRVNFVVGEASGSTTFPDDDTPPTSGEGTQIASQAITLLDAAHKVRVTGEVFISCSTGGADASIAVFRGSTNILSVGPTRFSAGGTTGIGIPINCIDTPGSVGPHTYSIRVGLANGSAGTWATGGTATARYGDTQALNTVTLEEFA